MRKAAFVMSLLAILASLFGCGAKRPKTDFPSPVPLPEGETLTALHMTRQGMRSGLHYILAVEDEEIFFKITNMHPYGEEHRFNAKDNLDERAKCRVASKKDTQALREIEEVLVECGTVGWDGFNEELIRKNVTDTGERYEVYLRFSGGSTVSVYGIDTCPDRYNEMFMRITEIFHRTVKWE